MSAIVPKTEGCEYVMRDSLFVAALCGRVVREPLGSLKFCRKHRALVLESLIDHFAANKRMRSMIEKRANPDSYETMFDRRMIELIEVAAATDREREKRERSVVYFVQRDDLVKIGVTAKGLEKRILEISRGSSAIRGMTLTPVKLLAAIHGGRREEKELHRRFAQFHVGGEWFRFDGELREYIEGLQADVGLHVVG